MPDMTIQDLLSILPYLPKPSLTEGFDLPEDLPVDSDVEVEKDPDFIL